MKVTLNTINLFLGCRIPVRLVLNVQLLKDSLVDNDNNIVCEFIEFGAAICVRRECWQFKVIWRWESQELILSQKKVQIPNIGAFPPIELKSSWSWSHGSWIYNYLCNQCLSLLMLWVRISNKARCTTLCDKVCQWFSPGPRVSSTNNTNRHDITEILLKVALNTIKQTNKLIELTLVL